MKYLLAFLKDLTLGFSINSKRLRLTLFILHFQISLKKFRIALIFPKYGLIITNEENYTFGHPGYCSYIKHIKNIKICISNLLGDKWENRTSLFERD